MVSTDQFARIPPSHYQEQTERPLEASLVPTYPDKQTHFHTTETGKETEDIKKGGAKE